MKTFVYRWNGRYFGFISNGRLFDASSNYLGWVDEQGRVWRASGSFLGELVDGNYILRRTSMATPASRVARSRPSRPTSPTRRTNRTGRTPRAGWIDALNEYGGN